MATLGPTAVTRAPEATPVVVASAGSQPVVAQVEPVRPVGSPQCDLTTTCPTCMIEMLPEHAHYKCPRCGYRDSCCF